jgi:hypothetical protein
VSKIDANLVVGSDVTVSLLWGVVVLGLSIFFPLVGQRTTAKAGCLCSAWICNTLWFMDFPGFGWGYSTSTESLILAQDERWRRA